MRKKNAVIEQPQERIIRLPPLHTGQFQIAQSTSRFRVVSAGRRFGKGVLAIGELFKKGITGSKVRFVPPSYASDSYQAAWAMATTLATQIPGVEIHQQRREFNFSALGGKWLQFRTAEEPDGLRGEGVDLVVFDEAAHIPNLKDIWELAVRPSLMDRLGGAWFISTPKGHNYFHELYRKGENGEKDWQSFQFSTNANPHINADEIAEMRRELPALVARQEIDAEFVQLAGALFMRENIQIVRSVPDDLRWVRSWDLAFTTKTTSDFTAGVKMAVDGDANVYIENIVHGRWEWPATVRKIAETAGLDGPGVRQGIEVVGAQLGMLQTLLNDPLLVGLTFTPIQVTKDKVSRALPLVARVEQKKLFLLEGSWNKAFIDELSCFDGSGHTHDDATDAASAALTMLGTPSGAWNTKDLPVEASKPDVHSDYDLDLTDSYSLEL